MNNTNEVVLKGKVISNIVKDYTYKGTEYYKFYVKVMRLSKNFDVLPVIVPKPILLARVEPLKKYDDVTVIGEYRSFNDLAKGKKVILYAYAKEIKIAEHETNERENNKILMDGHICKIGDYRISPNGRKVVDVIIAVNRYKKTSYIPCIIWNWDVNGATELKVGDEIYIIGRIQSREYLKRYDEENSEMKIAYEVSVSKFGIID